MHRPVLLLLVLFPATLFAQGATNLLTDGQFATDKDGNGLADGWEYATGAPAKELDVKFSRQEIAPGRFAQCLDCTRYEGGHAMLCQTGTVAIKAGQWYEVKLRARGENLRQAHVGLHDTNGWHQLGLWRSMSLTRRWRDFSYRFQGDHDAHKTTRFQIWFTSTGSLWVSDVSLTAIAPPPLSNVIAEDGDKNLLPNAGFDAPGGWGMVNYWTYGWTVAPGQGPDGSNCAAITWRPGDTDYEYYFDYFDMTARPLEHPYLQAIGYVPLHPGTSYTLSGWMRCDREGAPAMLGLRGPGAWSDKQVSLSSRWQRFSVTTKATGNLAVVQIGPDFAAADAAKYSGATVWIDNVQLEQGEQATDFQPQTLDVLAPSFLNTCATIAPQSLDYKLNVVAREPAPATVTLKLTNFSDKQVGVITQHLSLKAGANSVTCHLNLPGPGFYRCHIAVDSGGKHAEASARGALCLHRPETDTPFGINHAYSYNGMLREAQELGITWVRDWSLKWNQIEPQKGRFVFAQSDVQIDRPQKLGLHVLCMFPFPSAEWSSSAPLKLSASGYPGMRARQAFAPKNLADLENYAYQCVKHYRGRIHVWEVFNESLHTNYSLPEKQGYKAADYVPLLQAVYRGCKRADPACQVIGGYSAPPGARGLYPEMFAAGGLRYCDLFSLHDYPGGAPEFLQHDLAQLNSLMDKSGGRKPLWMTEYAYYADDDPDPFKHTWPALLDSEYQQACWNTRACVIMLGNGVQKIFYHIWGSTLNRDGGTAIFFKYAGAPRKIAASQAAMVYFLGARPRCVQRFSDPNAETYGYVFAAPPYLQRHDHGQTYIGVVWMPGGTVAIPRVPGADYYDLCGCPLASTAVPLGEAPLYVRLVASSAQAAATALRRTMAVAVVP